MDRAPGPSARLKLTLSYAGFLMVAGVLLLAVVWVFLLRYVPDHVRLYATWLRQATAWPARVILLAGAIRLAWCSVRQPTWRPPAAASRS